MFKWFLGTANCSRARPPKLCFPFIKLPGADDQATRRTGFYIDCRQSTSRSHYSTNQHQVHDDEVLFDDLHDQHLTGTLRSLPPVHVDLNHLSPTDFIQTTSRPFHPTTRAQISFHPPNASPI
jgi:hypothetical protein